MYDIFMDDLCSLETQRVCCEGMGVRLLQFLIIRNYWYVIIINVVYLWMIYVLSKHEESDVNAWEPNSLSFEGLVVI